MGPLLQLKVGIQLESLRLPFRKALLTAARIGVDAVEINARSEMRLSEMSRSAIRHIRKLLSDLNLSLASLHFPTRRGYDETDDLDRRIDATKLALSRAYELGTNVVVNQVGRVPETMEDPRWHTMLEALSDIGRHAQRVGAFLAARTGSESGPELGKLLDALPPGAMGVDFDPGNLIINGFSADEAMKSLGKHVLHFRARDGVQDLAQGRGLEVQLGRGSVDLASLLAGLEEHHYNGYMTIERATDDEPVLQCSQAVEFLRNLFV